MTDHPISFGAPMVRALLDGRKTMTRRLAWKDGPCFGEATAPSHWQRVTPGDKLWVRESCRSRCLPNVFTGEPTTALCGEYAADGEPCLDRAAFDFAWWYTRKTCPSIHMPRWVSRLTLIVTAVRIERLQEISKEDAIAEGAHHFDSIPVGLFIGRNNRWSMEEPINTDQGLSSARFAFANYWIKLYGQQSWEANPEVIVIGFTVHKGNIDWMEKTA